MKNTSMHESTASSPQVQHDEQGQVTAIGTQNECASEYLASSFFQPSSSAPSCLCNLPVFSAVVRRLPAFERKSWSAIAALFNATRRHRHPLRRVVTLPARVWPSSFNVKILKTFFHVKEHVG